MKDITLELLYILQTPTKSVLIKEGPYFRGSFVHFSMYMYIFVLYIGGTI